jgi:hypothetical protein
LESFHLKFSFIYIFRHLEERERLADKVKDLENRLLEKDNDAKILVRRLQLEAKNFKAQMMHETQKNRDLHMKLERAHLEITRLVGALEIYEKKAPNSILKSNSYLLKNCKSMISPEVLANMTGNKKLTNGVVSRKK